MAGAAQGNAYATNILVVQKVFYGQNWSLAYKVSFVSLPFRGARVDSPFRLFPPGKPDHARSLNTTDRISMGGLLRRFLVWPASMIGEFDRKAKKGEKEETFLADFGSFYLQGLHLLSTPLFSTLFTLYLQEE